MKKIALLIVWICGLTGTVSAQTFTNTRYLSEWADRLKQAGTANYVKALAMARQKGWDLSIPTKNGGVAKLVGVDERGFPKYYTTFNNTIAAATTRTNQLWPGGASGLNLSGSSANMKNKLGIWDGGGVLSTHVELKDRITQKDNPRDGISEHSTHVTGTMMATGINPSAKGMAFGLQGLVAYDFFNDVAEMTNEAVNGNLLLSNHSYGDIAGWFQNPNANNRWEFHGDPGKNEDYKFGYYDEGAAQLDQLAYNAPFYLIVKAAGNTRAYNGPAVGQPYYRFDATGTQVSSGNRPEGISSNDSYDGISDDVGAKNILTVGATSGLPTGYSRKEDVVTNNFSSWGPTDDGRIKPDVMADGINVLSTISASNTSYGLSTGTSMAAPNATGSLLLLQEYYSKLKGGAFLRSATLKGLAIHTADEAGASAGPDYQYGWGLLNVEKAAAVITSAVGTSNGTTSPHQMYELTLAQGATYTTTVTASGKGPLQATICWTDIKGTVEALGTLNSRNKKLVNDLDIRITTGSGATLKTYMPWTLNVNNPAGAAVPGDNVLDNVERIDIENTIPGQVYTITVTHKGTLVSGPQAFSLLISGTGGTPYCASASGGGGARIDNVTYSNVTVTNTAGSKTYTDNTANVFDIEPGQTAPIKIKVNTADATTANRIVKVFIDYNNNGVFDVPAELAVTSGTLTSVAQNFTGSVVTPPNLALGTISLMRVIVQETSSASDVAPCGTYGKGETQDFRVRVVNPSNDMTISDILAPVISDCGTPVQYLTIDLKNNGAVSQTNIPVTVSIANGATNVSTLNFTYPGPILPLTSVAYTFQTPFATSGGVTYSVTATVNLPVDQYAPNNTLITTITTAASPAEPSAIASNCGASTVYLKVNSPDASANYFWYNSATSTSPIATGPLTSVNTRTSNNTYYVASGAKVTVGPANKQVYTSGGYNIFRGNYVKINNSVPAIIETARLYIGYPGLVKITLADLVSEDLNTGSFSYLPIAATTLDVYATTPNVMPGAQTLNSTADTGAIYRLDLPVPTTGDHILIIECSNSQGRTDSATIFRNNNITSTNTYPQGVSNIFSITGNSAHTAGVAESGFYYFFYDMKVSTLDCVSDRIAVAATTPAVPVITKVGDALVSNSAATAMQQWYLNGNAISGATTNQWKPLVSGKYKIIVTDAFGCQTSSAETDFTLTATIDVTAREIGLNVSPNPNNGVFNLSFEVTTKADLLIEIMSASGQKVYSSKQPDFVGKYSKQITLQELSSEFYILKIQHDKKTYLQKLLIQR